MTDENKPHAFEILGKLRPRPSVMHTRWAFVQSAVPVYEIDDPVYPDPRWRALVKNPKHEWVAVFTKRLKEKNPDWEKTIAEFVAAVPGIERHELEDGSTAFAGGEWS